MRPSGPTRVRAIPDRPVIGSITSTLPPLAPLFGRVARAYLIGKSMDDFEATLDGTPVSQRRAERSTRF